MNKRFAAFVNISFGFAGLGFNIISGLFFVPFYLRHIDDATYGAWLASGGVVAILGIAESGLSTVLTQKLASAFGEQDGKRFATLACTGAQAAVWVGLVVVLLGSIVAWFAPVMFGCPSVQVSRMRMAIFLAAVGGGAMIVAYSLGAVAQALQSTMRQGFIVLLAMASGLCVIWLGFYVGLGVVSFGCGSLCVGCVMIVGNASNNNALWRDFRLPERNFRRAALRELWADAKSLFLARVSNGVASNLQSPAAALAFSAESSAILGLNSRIISLVPMLVDRIGSAVFAGVAHLALRAPRERNEYLREILNITTVVSGIGLGLAICFSKPFITLWVGERRYAGNTILWLLAVSSFFAIRQTAYSNLLTAMGEIKAAAHWLVVDSILRTALLLLVARWLQLPGIPMANIIASGVVAIGLTLILTRSSKVPAGIIWLSGGPGFVVSLMLAMAWYMWIPVPRTWLHLIWQATTCACCMFVGTVIADSAWRSAVKRNYLSAKISMTTLANRFIGRKIGFFADSCG